ncbi:MAG: response regulator receiver modulated diguanylate cyclase/phosphodiesterase with sensor [Candidatus Eremiobacteraeota bacterium]|nr:response regulator receiver modulated diguanylate cyclase/phosphodiesterase with sensor [Candidatus Eremiobacteraeota bacterium]
MAVERRFERVLEITRDILRLRELDLALESIARGVSDLFGFEYVTIVLADGNQTGEMTRRVLLGYGDAVTAQRKNERVAKADILAVLAPHYEVFENAFYIPAEREFHWERAIFSGEADRDSPRETPDAWHERDSLCLVLRDSDGEMIGYLSPDGPGDGKIPTRETLRGLQLFVNLMGLALANAQAHRAEVERRRLLEANQARLRHEATHDALTGLPNRTFFQERLAATLEHARSRPDRVFAVLFVDLDEFKSINDSLGHMAGDALLIAIGERMRATVGADDFIARIGGDEFALLLAHRHDLGQVQDAVETIQDALVAPMLIEGRAVYNTASIGIAIIEPNEERIEEVLRNADTAMYHAKSLGRGRHAFFDHHMHYEAARRLALTSDLRAAIENEQFNVEYQPIVRLDDGRVMGFEALVRWRNPATGQVLPGEFIPLAEEVGLVVPIGRFVFVDACRRLSEWRRRAPLLDLRMHVNLSVQEVLEPDLDAFVARNLRRFGLSSDDIVLEITESAVIRSNTLSLGSLARLRATGVHLCIDDFGTGYSSLRYLHQLPFDAMKIDRSFVESTDGGLGSAPIVRMLIQLARSYGIDVVAEGVETERQAEELVALDCEYAQGFHFYRPMSADAVAALLDSTIAVAAS